MFEQNRVEVLVHTEFGRIPARKLLDCIFALSPDGPILHHHLEEVDVSEELGTTLYTINGSAPLSERSRCQIIPPVVPAFPILD
tara:strand:- start:163 stop:414 length:252 start_codon:yes stop_codon:yes gene_type:complete